ncbi:MAG: AsmA-like C-terminal region-containing protein [Pirellulales bacterium]
MGKSAWKTNYATRCRPRQEFWNRLRPRGSIDLHAEVTYLSSQKKVAVAITTVPLADTVSLDPVFFPLKLEKLRGTFRFAGSRLDFENIQAEHDRLPITFTGYCEGDDAGQWHARFDRVVADRLRPEKSTLQFALPPKVRKFIQAVAMAGSVDLTGSLDLWGREDKPGELTAGWDVELDLHDVSAKLGLDVSHLDGSLRLIGKSVGEALRMQGELAIDSVFAQDLQLTNVRGPIYMDEKQILFGGRTQQQTSGQRLRQIEAQAYGGTLQCDGWIGLEETPRFTLATRLDDFDLNRFGREQLAGRQSLGGKIQGGMELGGTFAGSHTFAGRGRMHLTEAKLGELPVMLAMLKVFSVREPDRTAFDTGDIGYRIEGEHVYFDSIELSGNAVSLLGTGEMSFQRELKLVFSAVAGRSDWQMPAFKSLLGSASQQLMEIHVGGSLANPEIKRESFPGLKESLDQLQAERRNRRQNEASRK